MTIPSGATAGTYFYHQDALGSVVALSKFNTSLNYAEIVERYQYSAFGDTTVCDGGGTPLTPNQSAYDNSYMYTGREYETLDSNNLKLYYYRARFYKPEIGRFLQTDPIGYSDSMNLYQYCGNNPINFIDSFGLKWQYRGNTKIIRETVDHYRSISPRFNQSYQILEESSIIYTIQTTDGKDWYNADPSSKTVYWNPQNAYRHPWGTNSPAFCLAHEMEHPRAYFDNIDRIIYDDKKQTETGFFSSQDESLLSNHKSNNVNWLEDEFKGSDTFFATLCDYSTYNHFDFTGIVISRIVWHR